MKGKSMPCTQDIVDFFESRCASLYSSTMLWRLPFRWVFGALLSLAGDESRVDCDICKNMAIRVTSDALMSPYSHEAMSILVYDAMMQ